MRLFIYILLFNGEVEIIWPRQACLRFHECIWLGNAQNLGRNYKV